MPFEYAITSVEEPTDAHAVQVLLDAYGKDNWDLAFVTQNEKQLRLFFRKPVAEVTAEPAETMVEVEQTKPAQQVRPLTQRLVGMAELEKMRGQRESSQG